MARGQVPVKAVLFGVGSGAGGVSGTGLARPIGETVLSHGTGGVLGSCRCPLGGAVLRLPTVCHQNRGVGRDVALLLKDRKTCAQFIEDTVTRGTVYRLLLGWTRQGNTLMGRDRVYKYYSDKPDGAASAGGAAGDLGSAALIETMIECQL